MNHSSLKLDRPHLTIAMEAIFEVDNDGAVTSPDIYGPRHWSLHLGLFERITFFVRVRKCEHVTPTRDVFPPKTFSFWPVPHFRGLMQAVTSAATLFFEAWKCARSVEAVVLRLPGTMGSLLGLALILQRKHYSVQMVGDCEQVLGDRNLSLPLRLLKTPASLLTRLLCRHASCCAYVTSSSLQKKFPANPTAQSFAFSNVELLPADFATREKVYDLSIEPRILFCGSFEQLYKGFDVLIEAVARLVDRFPELTVEAIGDGRFRQSLETLSVERGVSARFVFRGSVSRGEVQTAMDRANLFVLPSRTEGMPRVVIEAMARGLPCVGTAVGGIPELLEPVALVQPDNAQALAKTIADFLESPALMNSQAYRNLVRAREFEHSVLNEQRSKFFGAVALAANGQG